MYGARIETKTVLIYFLETEPRVFIKVKNNQTLAWTHTSQVLKQISSLSVCNVVRSDKFLHYLYVMMSLMAQLHYHDISRVHIVFSYRILPHWPQPQLCDSTVNCWPKTHAWTHVQLVISGGLTWTGLNPTTSKRQDQPTNSLLSAYFQPLTKSGVLI